MDSKLQAAFDQWEASFDALHRYLLATATTQAQEAPAVAKDAPPVCIEMVPVTCSMACPTQVVTNTNVDPKAGVQELDALSANTTTVTSEVDHGVVHIVFSDLTAPTLTKCSARCSRRDTNLPRYVFHPAATSSWPRPIPWPSFIVLPGGVHFTEPRPTPQDFFLKKPCAESKEAIPSYAILDASCLPGYFVNGSQMQVPAACSTRHLFPSVLSSNFRPVVMLELQLTRSGSRFVHLQALQMDRSGIEGAALTRVIINVNPCLLKCSESILAHPADLALYCSSFSYTSVGIFCERNLEFNSWVSCMVEQYSDMSSYGIQSGLHFLCINIGTVWKQNRSVVHALLILFLASHFKLWQPNGEFSDVSTAIQFTILNVKYLLFGNTDLFLFTELWVTQFIFQYFQWHVAWTLPIFVPSKVSQCVLSGVSPHDCSLRAQYCSVALIELNVSLNLFIQGLKYAAHKNHIFIEAPRSDHCQEETNFKLQSWPSEKLTCWDNPNFAARECLLATPGVKKLATSFTAMGLIQLHLVVFSSCSEWWSNCWFLGCPYETYNCWGAQCYELGAATSVLQEFMGTSNCYLHFGAVQILGTLVCSAWTTLQLLSSGYHCVGYCWMTWDPGLTSHCIIIFCCHGKSDGCSLSWALEKEKLVSDSAAGHVQHIMLQSDITEIYQLLTQPGEYLSLCLQPKPPWLCILTKIDTHLNEGVHPHGEDITPYSELPIGRCLHELHLARREMEAGLHSFCQGTSRPLMPDPRIPHGNKKMELCRAARELLILQTQGQGWTYQGFLFCGLHATLLPTQDADEDGMLTWKRYRVHVPRTKVPWDPGGSTEYQCLSTCDDQAPSKGGRRMPTLGRHKDLRSPWVPGGAATGDQLNEGSRRWDTAKFLVASAWGQAEFQGGRDVRNPTTNTHTWAGSLVHHMGLPTSRSCRLQIHKKRQRGSYPEGSGMELAAASPPT